MVEWIFKAQIDIALELGIISREVDGYIDYTNKYFYGSDTNSTNSEIISVYNIMIPEQIRLENILV